MLNLGRFDKKDKDLAEGIILTGKSKILFSALAIIGIMTVIYWTSIGVAKLIELILYG